MIIAFVGLDGAGKSTLARMLRENLTRPDYKVSLLYLGHGYYSLKATKLLHSLRQHSSYTIRALLKVPFIISFLFDLQHRSRLAHSRQSQLLLLDRYPYFEPLSSISLINKIINFAVARLVAKPDMFIFLDTKCLLTQWERKQEGSFADFKLRSIKLKNTINKLVSEGAVVHTFDCVNDGLDFIVSDILQLVSR